MSAAVVALQPLREVRLYGHLGRQFGRCHRLAVESPAEAVRALMALFKGFQQAILSHPSYHVLIGRGQRRQDLGEEALGLKVGSANCIRIVPAVTGAKRQGIGKIIVGSVLIVAGLTLNYLYGPNFVSSALIKVGAALVIGGVVQVLSPQRKQDNTDRASTASYAFDGPVNVVDEGGPVPILIGRMIVGSVVISSGLSSDQLLPVNGPPIINPPLPPGDPQYPWHQQSPE